MTRCGLLRRKLALRFPGLARASLTAGAVMHCAILAGLLCLPLLARAAQAAEPDVTLMASCQASPCTPYDSLDIKVTGPDPKTFWESTGGASPQLSVADPLVPERAVAVRADWLQKSADGNLQFDLRRLVFNQSRDRGDLLAMLFRKPSPLLRLKLRVREPDGKDPVADFQLDLGQAYRDGDIGLIYAHDAPGGCGRGVPGAAACGFKDTLLLPLANLQQWRVAMGRQGSPLVLYLNGVPMPELAAAEESLDALSAAAPQARPSAAYPVKIRLTRDLTREPSARAWRSVLEDPALPGDSPSGVPLSVAVGVDSMRWTDPETITLARPAYVPWTVALLVAVLLYLIGAFTPTLRGTRMLSASVAALQTRSQSKTEHVPFDIKSLEPPHSLSAFLMAVWLLVVFLSFVALWHTTRSDDLMNSTAMSLIGIVTGSFVFARAIDAPSSTDRALDQSLAAAIASFDPHSDASATAVHTALTQARSAGLATSGLWLADLLSETGSTRFDLHRVQLAAFSAVYFVIFLQTLYITQALPEFSSETLGLLGISSAGYLGFKYTAA